MELFFERLFRGIEGDSEAWKDFGKTVSTNIGPENPVDSNIFSPIYNLSRNKDFADRTIVPQSMQDLSPKYQYDEKTSEISKMLGDKFNLSPKQIDYLIKSYTGVIGQIGIPATTKMNYTAGDTRNNLLNPITKQFISDPLYSNNEMQKFYENKDKLENIAADKNFIGKIPSKVVTPEEAKRNLFNKTNKSISEDMKKIREFEQKGDEQKIRELRLQMIKKALEANNKAK